MTTRYTKDHEWIRLDGEVATVGISEHAQSALGDIVYVSPAFEAEKLKNLSAYLTQAQADAAAAHSKSGSVAVPEVATSLVVQNIQEAIEAPKFSSAHFPSTFYPHGTRPGVLRIEERVDEKTREQLASRGHLIELRPPWSEGHVLAVELDRSRGLLRGGCDPRGQQVPSMPAATIGW